MKKPLKSIARIAATALMMLTMVPRVAPVYAAPKGNNGTLKVHEIGTPTGTESNDPKVCAFNFEGFDFDASQSGYINIDTQGGSAPIGVSAGPFNFGPTDANGYAISQDFNTLGSTTIFNGTYKATLYGKDAAGGVNLNDEKAESKVFKVSCQSHDVFATTVGATTFNDPGCNTDATYTIVPVRGITFKVNGITKSPGTYTVTPPTTVTITAEADVGFIIDGPASWSYDFKAPENCPIEPDDACPNIDQVQANVPVGMIVDDSGNCVLPTQGNGDDPVDPVDPVDPIHPIVLPSGNGAAAAPASASLSDPADATVLPKTGPTAPFELILALVGSLTATAVVSRRTSVKKPAKLS